MQLEPTLKQFVSCVNNSYNNKVQVTQFEMSSYCQGNAPPIVKSATAFQTTAIFKPYNIFNFQIPKNQTSACECVIGSWWQAETFDIIFSNDGCNFLRIDI